MKEAGELVIDIASISAFSYEAVAVVWRCCFSRLVDTVFIVYRTVC
jgi:hypothetical protein